MTAGCNCLRGSCMFSYAPECCPRFQQYERDLEARMEREWVARPSVSRHATSSRREACYWAAAAGALLTLWVHGIWTPW